MESEAAATAGASPTSSAATPTTCSTPSCELDLFDAKFKVRRLADAVPTATEVDEADQAAERRGVFKHADLYKMHTYRDAIAEARSVWILYPGSEFRFYDEVHGPIDDLARLVLPAAGVGALPLRPGQAGTSVADLVRRMVAPAIMGSR